MNQERRGRNTWTQFNDVQETKDASQYATVTSSYQGENASSAFGTIPLVLQDAGQNRLGFVETSNAASTTYNDTLVALTQIARSHEADGDGFQSDFAHGFEHCGRSRPAPDNTLITDTAPLLDPWALSPEQKAYYLSQFLRLQPDPRAKLSGLQAKAFFELSKLPNTELSDIWELSDADCDGQLTLGEFCVAMHLVVLRRNGVPIPRILPCALMAVITSQSLFTLASEPQSVGGKSFPMPQPKRTGGRLDDQATVVSQGLTNNRRPFSPPSLASGNSCIPSLSPSRLTPTSGRIRRWSLSSQSDISSLAEGIMHFEARPSSTAQLQHPIPLRSRTLPLSGSCQVGLLGTPVNAVSPPPPPPPPRAYLTTCNGNGPRLLADTQLTPVRKDRMAADGAHKAKDDIFSFTTVPFSDKLDGFATARKEPLDSTVTSTDNGDVNDPGSIVTRLRRECDEQMQANEKLALELMQLQQHRIALKILLERLTPLDASYPMCGSR
ncbi:RalBP1-associated Eps domain-containing protein 2 [Paragonimus heterotremus]|uniref:RalBP1-associated Eps domain-containing protein 2 n=1 Tax=Paragonimus heterotremus TaxID=100268 RepID=A0A8J4TAL1_9TREM|nr:RalBP1-associated Eps domain-containing protein 2 [Paragonimus heterotremus]